MPAFITPEQVKGYLWITDNSDDARIGMILDGILASIEPLEMKQRTEIIKRTSVYENRIPVTYPNITNLLLIEDETVDAFLVLDNGMIYVPNLSIPDEPYFSVKYESGYETCPNNILALVAQLVWMELSKEDWRTIQSESLWPRKVDYGDGTEESSIIRKEIAFFITPPYLRIF